MKILLITDGIPPSVLGGAGQVTCATAMGLAIHGHDVHLLTFTENEEKNPTLEGVTVHTLRKKSSRWAHYRSVFSRKRANEVLHVIQQIQPDIIHAHSIAWQTGYSWIPAAKKRGIPVILTAHDVMYVAYGRVLGDENRWTLAMRDLKRAKWTWNPLRNMRIQRILNTHCTVLCVSNALRTYLERFGFKNLTTLHNGINLDQWSHLENRNDAREKLHLPKDATVFLLAGRLGIDKGSAIVARTLPKEAHVLLAGDVDGASFAPLKERAHIFGRQTPDEMKLFYAASDVVLVPSICLDCFPTICIEAMAAGRAVLATTFGGAKESIENGVTGWIIDPRDEEAFQKQMEWCVAHRDELDDIGKRGRRRAEQGFSMKEHTKKLIEIYSLTNE